MMGAKRETAGMQFDEAKLRKTSPRKKSKMRKRSRRKKRRKRKKSRQNDSEQKSLKKTWIYLK